VKNWKIAAASWVPPAPQVPLDADDGPKWQTGPVTDHVRPAVAADVDAMTELAGARREQYAGY
jgi:hypothetical protein